MDGARQYGPYFHDKERIGKLIIRTGVHARGCTFHIFVLPDSGANQQDGTEVYGVVSGNPGWTETYGWLHNGPWQADFQAEYESRLARRAQEQMEREALRTAKEQAERQQKILAAYKENP